MHVAAFPILVFIPFTPIEYVPPHLRNGVQVPSQQPIQSVQQQPPANYNNNSTYYNNNQIPNVVAGNSNQNGQAMTYASINTSDELRNL